MVEAHETADVGLFWKFLVWMQHVSNSTDSAALVLIAKHRDVVYIGLLGVEVNVTTALRFVISMCIYVPHATSTSETEMVASFKKIHIACTWIHEYDVYYVTLILTWIVNYILMASSYQKRLYSLRGMPWCSVYMTVFLAIKRQSPTSLCQHQS